MDNRLKRLYTIVSDCIECPSLSADANSQCPGFDTIFANVDAVNSFNSAKVSGYPKRIYVRAGRTFESTRMVALSSKLDKLYNACKI